MQTIYLDISNKGVVPTIYAKQGDVGRKFEVIFTNSGLPYVPPDGSVFSVWYSGQSGEGNYTDIGDNSAFSINENKVTVELIAQMLTNDGSGILCIVLNESNGNQIGSWNIPYLCEKVPGIESEAAKEYYTAFSKSVEGLKQVTENLTPEAIGAAPAGYGLGANVSTMELATDANLCVKNGWYKLATNTPNGVEAPAVMRVDAEDEDNVIQTAFSGHYTNAGLISLQRKKFRGTWDAWEWVNPPMIPGSEYRTTERWNGKVVYTMLFNTGELANGGTFTYKSGYVNVVRYYASAGGAALPIHAADSWGASWSLWCDVSSTTVTAYMGGSRPTSALDVQVWYTID